VKILCRGAEVAKSLEDSRAKLGRRSVLICAGRTQVAELAGKMEKG
jgi:hypothetical protein